VSLDDELIELARLNDSTTQASLDNLTLDPAHLLRSLRFYLSRQSDYHHIERLREKAVQLTRVGGARKRWSAAPLSLFRVPR
jgi:hypothetical protein